MRPRRNATPAASRLALRPVELREHHSWDQTSPDLRPVGNAASRVIGTILKHDRKVTSYKLALIRALNDVVLSFPDAGSHGRPIAVPLPILAQYWVAYYWPFVDPRCPISQAGTRCGAVC